MSRKTTATATLALLAGALLAPATTLLSFTFDGVANDTGGLTFQQVKNTLSNGEDPVGTANVATGVITTGTGTGQQTTSSGVGFNTSSPFNVSTSAPIGTTGFTVTFHVTGTTAEVSTLFGGGLFFGVVTGTDSNLTGTNSLYQNNPYAIGYANTTQIGGNHSLRQDAEGGATNESNSISTSLGTAPTDASFEDGFTIALSLFDDNTWGLTSTGLSSNIDSTGSLATGTGMKTYADIVTAVTPYVSLQGEPNSTVTIDRITITAIPEPSGAVMLGASTMLVLLRRKRS